MQLLRVVAIVLSSAAAIFTSTDAANLRGSSTTPAVDCGAPASIYQGSVKFSSTGPGSTASYTCMKGTTMKGPSTMRCSNQGIWSPQPPECRVVYTTANDNTYKNHDAGYKLYSG